MLEPQPVIRWFRFGSFGPERFWNRRSIGLSNIRSNFPRLSSVKKTEVQGVYWPYINAGFPHRFISGVQQIPGLQQSRFLPMQTLLLLGPQSGRGETSLRSDRDIKTPGSL